MLQTLSNAQLEKRAAKQLEQLAPQISTRNLSLLEQQDRAQYLRHTNKTLYLKFCQTTRLSPFASPFEHPRLPHVDPFLLHATPLWVPSTPAQYQTMKSPAEIILYGGQAGSGKTDLAIGLALTQHQRTLYIRKEFIQLQPVIDRIATLLQTRKGYNGQDKIFRCHTHNRARQIQFGGCASPGDEQKHQGNPKDFLVLDEAVHLLEDQVYALMGWVRSDDPDQRQRALLCTNPPTDANGLWIIPFFGPWLDPNHPNPARPGEIRWFARIHDKDTEVPNGNPVTVPGITDPVQPKSRTFIPGKLKENRYLMQTGYMAQLQMLREPLRTILLEGKFLAGIQDDMWQIIPSAWVDAAQQLWRQSIDKFKNQYPPPRQSSIGLDPSRGGVDESVIAIRYGNFYDELITYPGQAVPDGPTIGAQTIKVRRDQCPIHVDAIGIGSAVVDFFKQQQVHYVPVVSNAKSPHKDANHNFGFANLRAQLWWQFYEALNPNLPLSQRIALPPDDRLKQQLCAPTYRLLANKTVQVESKEDVRRRIGTSTDLADAVLYASMRTPTRQQDEFHRHTSGRPHTMRGAL